MNTEHRRKFAGWMGAVILLLGVGDTAFAADWWLGVDLSVAGAKPGVRLLHLWEGAGGGAETEHPLEKERVSRFDLYVDQARRRDLLAASQEGQMPAAKIPPEPSASLVVMERKEGSKTVDADTFNRMLAEEGQEVILAQRTRLGQSGAEVRETDFGYLKTLVPGQDPLSTLPNTFYKRRVEQRLEVLLQNNPGRLTANHRLTVKVLFEGKPLAGAKVFALRRDGVSGGATGAAGPATGIAGAYGPAELTAVTSAQGLAEFKIDQNGAWLLRTAHLHAGGEARKANAGGGAWEHFAASYSFVTKDGSAGGGMGPGKSGGGTSASGEGK